MNCTHIANNNPLLNRFNNFTSQNPSHVPFQSNQLMNQNVHVMNNLNKIMKQPEFIHDTLHQSSHRSGAGDGKVRGSLSDKANKSNGNNNKNIIEEMLKPQKISRDGKDVLRNFNDLEHKQKTEIIEITNAPYKNIIKDKIITKHWKAVKEEDLIVHKDTEQDRNRKKFYAEVRQKKVEEKKINNELEIEFHIDNYDKHKDKFEYKESFIRNLAYKSKNFDETKDDYIDFYRRHQKEAEDGQELCDKILHNMIDTGLIKPEELPSNIDDIN
jgi:hypothetical protein